jgi:hypothetical protein
VIDVS